MSVYVFAASLCLFLVAGILADKNKQKQKFNLGWSIVQMASFGPAFFSGYYILSHVPHFPH